MARLVVEGDGVGWAGDGGLAGELFVQFEHRGRRVHLKASAKGYAAAIVTPAWQGKTPFAWKIPGARIAEPQFGGILIRQGDEEHFYRRKVWSVGRSAEE